MVQWKFAHRLSARGGEGVERLEGVHRELVRSGPLEALIILIEERANKKEAL